MTLKADNNTDPLQVVVDSITAPAGDVQVVKLMNGTPGDPAMIAGGANGLEVNLKTIAAIAAVMDAVFGLGVDVKRIKSPSTGAHTTKVASAATQLLLAANTARLDAAITNESTANLYVALAGTASATAYIVKMTPGSYYELPSGYTGQVAGVWDVANGNARITELT